jgi:hypothetical protein
MRGAINPLTTAKATNLLGNAVNFVRCSPEVDGFRALRELHTRAVCVGAAILATIGLCFCIFTIVAIVLFTLLLYCLCV